MVPAMLFYMYKSEQKYDNASEWLKKALVHNGCNQKVKDLLNEWNDEMLVTKKQTEEGEALISKPVSVTITNLGNTINTIYDEYFPSLTADESTFIFTSRREGSTGVKDSEGEYDEDLWYCEKGTDGNWGSPKNMGKPVNIENNNAVASFTGDGQYVVCTRCNEDDGYGSCDNYFSTLKGKEWSKPKNMGSLVNSKEWDSQACISVDGKKMIFASKRENGYGKSDLWISEIDNNGDWTAPKNLGSTINTSGDEFAPFFHPDGKTLYFSSNNISPRIGGDDIYKSVLQDNGTWSTPENVGYPINTKYNDRYFILSPSGLTGYLASDRPGSIGKDDIYKIDFPQEKKTALVTVVGFVYDELTRLPIVGDVEIQDVEKNEVVGSYKSNEATGKFVVVLTPGRNYSLSVNKKDYLFYSENFNIPDSNAFMEVKKEIYLQKITAGKKIVLNNIFFESGKSDLKIESQIEINRLLALMNENPLVKVEISGHTDNVGDDKSNMILSQARADVVVNALIEKGIPKSRMISKGYGKSLITT
jgi:outer membrane protein OmpA-like peptidoglycan-associated protein/Tol biopolymer transport system component